MGSYILIFLHVRPIISKNKIFGVAKDIMATKINVLIEPVEEYKTYQLKIFLTHSSIYPLECMY